jgi:hypothetical protein
MSPRGTLSLMQHLQDLSKMKEANDVTNVCHLPYLLGGVLKHPGPNAVWFFERLREDMNVGQVQTSHRGHHDSPGI